MDDKISVIIPVYNGEYSVERCIRSILSSKYSNLEIILVDDGSTDRSGSLCDGFANADPRIIVFHLKNGGVSKARNFGISQAKGKYLTFIDCDDYVEDSYFMDLYNNIRLHKSDLAVGSIANIYGTDITYVFADEAVVRLDSPDEQDRVHFLELNSKFLLYGPVNKLYIADYIKESGITFPEDTSYGEDLLFNMQYLKSCNSLSYLRAPVYFYDHSNECSLSQKYRPNLFENGLRINMSLKDFFSNIGFWGVEEKKYIYRRIFDDAYNSIFDLWNSRCRLSLFDKIKRIREILNNPEVCQAYDLADIKDYSKLYVLLMQNHMVLTIALIRQLRTLLFHRA